MKIRFHFAALCAAIALTGCVENMQVKSSRFIDKLSSDAYKHYAKINSNAALVAGSRSNRRGSTRPLTM